MRPVPRLPRPHPAGLSHRLRPSNPRARHLVAVPGTPVLLSPGAVVEMRVVAVVGAGEGSRVVERVGAEPEPAP